MDVTPLRRWFLKEKRDLPWREQKTPYRVWISEVMLQQTQVAVVIGYFHRWMRQFPTMESLANASIEEVIKAWEGLGYYARARNIHSAAKIFATRFNGTIPPSRSLLEDIKGFGPYTIGAVLSFAFEQKAAAVDGNVIRVLSRLFASTRPDSDKKYYQDLTESILPNNEPWVIMEALIELGATVCQKKPKCSICPLQEKCLASRQAIAHTLPVKKEKAVTIELLRNVCILVYEDEVLVGQELGAKVMEGLYQFPFFEKESKDPFEFEKEFIQDLLVVKHGFTRYRATLFPSVWRVKERVNLPGFIWTKKASLLSLPFSSGHRRVLNHFMDLN